MAQRRTGLWIAAAIIGLALALCAGVLALPSVRATPDVGPVVAMEPLRTVDGRIFTPAPPPPPDPQPVPAADDLPLESQEPWERVHDRADWIGGGVVTCDLGVLADDAQTAHLDMDEGVQLSGTVDVLSRMFTQIEEGRISFAVSEPSGEARLMLSVPEPDVEPTDVEEMAQGMGNRSLRIRWSGAEQGRTVGCDAVWAPESGHLAVTIQGHDYETTGDIPPIVRGCGFMVPAVLDPLEVQVEAGTCMMRVERRLQTFPLIVSRSEPVVVRVQPGQTTDVTLTMPPEPSFLQPPDLTELTAAADIAGFFGSEAAAQALEELVTRIMNGEYSGDDLQDLMAEMVQERNNRPTFQEVADETNIDDPGAGQGGDLTDEEIEDLIRRAEVEVDTTGLEPEGGG